MEFSRRKVVLEWNAVTGKKYVANQLNLKASTYKSVYNLSKKDQNSAKYGHDTTILNDTPCILSLINRSAYKPDRQKRTQTNILNTTAASKKPHNELPYRPWEMCSLAADE